MLLNIFMKSLFFKGKDDVITEQGFAILVHLTYEICTKKPKQDLTELSELASIFTK